MARYRHPRLYGLAFEDWPNIDRRAWVRATAAHDLLEPAGLAAKWRPKTRLQVMKGYGQWLRFCRDRGFMDPTARPEQRINKERFKTYIDSLRQRVKPVTVVSRLTDLSEALRVMAPTADRSLIRLAISRLQAVARPSRNKAARIVDALELYQAGIRQMEEVAPQITT